MTCQFLHCQFDLIVYIDDQKVYTAYTGMVETNNVKIGEVCLVCFIYLNQCLKILSPQRYLIQY